MFQGRDPALRGPKILVTKCVSERCRWGRAPGQTACTLCLRSNVWSKSSQGPVVSALEVTATRRTHVHPPAPQPVRRDVLDPPTVCWTHSSRSNAGDWPPPSPRNGKSMMTTGWQGRGQTSGNRGPGSGSQALAISTWKPAA